MRMILSGTASSGGAPDPVIDVSIPDNVVERIRRIPRMLLRSGILDSGGIYDAFSTYREMPKHIDSRMAPEAVAQALHEAEWMRVEFPEINIHLGLDLVTSSESVQGLSPKYRAMALRLDDTSKDTSPMDAKRIVESVALFHARDPYVDDPEVTYESEMIDMVAFSKPYSVYLGEDFLFEHFHDAPAGYVDALRKAIAEYGQDASPSAG